MADNLLTPAQASREIGICTKLVYRLIKCGSIPAFRIGERKWMIPAATLNRWLNERAGGGVD